MDEHDRGLVRAAQEIARSLAQDRRPPRARAADGEAHFGPLFATVSHRPLPPVLLQQYDNVQYKCFVGLLPEIHRAWITFDNRLFLWKYDDDKDFNVWDGLDQVIVSVGLVVPKPGVFVDTIRYLLVLTTAVEIVVLGVSFAGDNVQAEMLLQPTDLTVPSDEVNMVQVVGTPHGRIFMCGYDGNLYELDYQAPGGSSWFSASNRCRKINHTQGLLGSYLPFLSNLYAMDPVQELRFDSSRNILYALTASSSIQGFWLGSDGRSMHHFATRGELQNDANVRARIYTTADFQIASIWPVAASESARIHLVAVASSGVRIFLTTTPNTSDKPYALQVVHVDHPVRDMRNRGSHCLVQSAMFAHGCLLMSTTAEGGMQLSSVDAEKPLFCVHFNMSAKEHGSTMDEPCATLTLAGTTWAMAEAPLPDIVLSSVFNSALVPAINVANELVTQHFIRRTFLCLTNQGLYSVERRRPVDQLVRCLELSQGNTEADELRMFFSYYGEAESCAMCLIVACSTTERSQIREYAASTFLYYGSVGGGKTSQQSQSATLAPSQSMLIGRPQQLSDRYQGFCLYLARLLYPVWQVPVNRITVYSREEVRAIRDALMSLLGFVEQTRWSALPTVSGTASGAALDASGSFNTGASALPFSARVIESLHARTPNHAEQQSLSFLVALLSRACQALSMLIVLNERDVTIIDQLSTDRAVVGAPFADLVAGQVGAVFIKLLIGFLMKAHTDQTDEMSKELSAACPLYFNQADRDFFLAVKLLREAALQQNEAARSELQQQSLTLFRRIANTMAFADAFTVIAEMQEQRFAAGAVEVAMLAAQARDKQRPSDLEDRLRCYRVIEATFEQLLSAPHNGHAALAGLTDHSADLYRRLKRLVLQNCGEECSRHLFRWYLQMGLYAELIEIESPLLEEFLRANDATFLAEYYTANHRFGDAAAAYLALADSDGPLDLNQRILYLGHAVANVKQADGHGVSEGQARLLTEKAEVAQIQRRVYHELTSSSGATTTPDELKRLNSHLFTISELYNQFAWPLQLWETCLVIMYTANHECPRALIEKIWSSIVQQERRFMAASRSAPALVASVARKVEHVARLSSLSLKVFPVDVICEQLEQLSFDLLRGQEGFDPCWVTRLMLDVGVSHNTLFDLYHHLFASLDSDRPRQVHYSLPLRFVVERWLEQKSRQQRVPLALMDDVILRLEEYTQAREEVHAWKQLVARFK